QASKTLATASASLVPGLPRRPRRPSHRKEYESPSHIHLCSHYVLIFLSSTHNQQDPSCSIRRIAAVIMDKCIWCDKEIEASVVFMEEFIIDGQKADCSHFKLETFEKLALKMLKAFPTSTLTAHPTKFYTLGKLFPLFHRLEGIFKKDKDMRAGAVSSFDAEEQVNEEIEDQTQGLDDSDMSSNTNIDGGQGGQGQASYSESGAGNTRHSGRKKKQTDQSSAAQGNNTQVIADALANVNGKFKISEKLEQLGFNEDEVVQVNGDDKERKKESRGTTPRERTEQNRGGGGGGKADAKARNGTTTRPP
ncbi:hypothetical protein HN873_068041, partial [Arachis hypogaea]